MSGEPSPAPPPDGLVAVVKRSCPTSVLVVPVLADLAERAPGGLTVYSQDDPSFPGGMAVVDDTGLATSFALDLETVPTLLRFEGGAETARVVGWNREQWEGLTGVTGLGEGLPAWRPGCGSRTRDPAVAAAHATEVGLRSLVSRRVPLGAEEDDAEAAYERGWSDGLPVVPPTPERVVRMLAGTGRDPSEVVTVVPPDLVECTVEKVAVNAVLAGCRPEHLPVVLAAVEAACAEPFNMHGLLATTWFAGPVVVVGGPVARAVGMNHGINALGPGNRANATIGRAVQLVVRNVGGGRPGEIDRATLGQPGKYTACFAEDDPLDGWPLLHEERGLPAGSSGVTVFAGEAPRGVLDQLSRDPASLARSFAACLRTTTHPKMVVAFDAMLVVSPEHTRVFVEAGWSKQRLADELAGLLQVDGDDVIRGAGGIAEGLDEGFAGVTLPKFRPGGLLITRAGGRAGLFSAIIGGWASGALGSDPVTREVNP